MIRNKKILEESQAWEKGMAWANLLILECLASTAEFQATTVLKCRGGTLEKIRVRAEEPPISWIKSNNI